MTHARRSLAPIAALLVAAGFLQTESRAESRHIIVTSDYLQIPVTALGKVRDVKITAEGSAAFSFPVEAADGEPQWYVPINVSAYRGKTVHVSVDGLPEGSRFLANILQTGERLPNAQGLYAEALRPLLHFTASHGWINDPNGPIFSGGKYHLFFQLDPSGYLDHTKFWGHATSRDLLHWEEQDMALAPDHFGPMWSGSAVNDVWNTSGLGTKEHPPLVLIYTAAGNPFTQCMAFSLDGGKTFKKYDRNPIVPNLRTDNRDPRVRWHEGTKKWVMVLWVRRQNLDHVAGDTKPPERDTIQFLTSPNLLDWTETSEIEGYFECPDLIPIGDRWVLTAASGAYQVGTFDGTTFKPSTPRMDSTRTPVFYAAQTFTELAPGDGRTLQIGWMRDSVSPGMPFNQCLSVIHELSLLETADGPRLTRNPHRELAGLRKTSRFYANTPFLAGHHFLGDLDSEAVELNVEFKPEPDGVVGFNLRGLPISYDAAKQELRVGNTRTHAPLRDGVQRLTALIDRTTVEVFAGDGLVYVPLAAIPLKSQRSMYIDTNAPLTFSKFEVHTLASMWPAGK